MSSLLAWRLQAITGVTTVSQSGLKTIFCSRMTWPWPGPSKIRQL